MRFLEKHNTKGFKTSKEILFTEKEEAAHLKKAAAGKKKGTKKDASGKGEL